jgi:hypothetical protein
LEFFTEVLGSASQAACGTYASGVLNDDMLLGVVKKRQALETGQQSS